MSGAGSVVTADGGELFDLGQGKLWAGFIRRSMIRHWKRALAVFLVIFALASFFALSSPKQYAASTEMIAKADQLSGSAIDPTGANRGQPPAVTAESEIKSQTNLEKIVDDLRLVQTYNVSEGTLAKAKRSFFEKIFGKPDEVAKRRDVVNELRMKLSVHTDDQEQIKQTIMADVIWNDPGQAKEILDAVNKNYLADRRKADVEPAEIDRDVLEESLNDQSKKVDELRFELNVPPDDERSLPDSSPLRAELDILKQLKERYTNARLNLTSVESAFRLRYATITPAEAPTAPMSGSLKPLIAGILAGLMLAAFACAATDLLRGKVVEPWQVARSMNLPLLAELGKS